MGGLVCAHRPRGGQQDGSEQPRDRDLPEHSLRKRRYRPRRQFRRYTGCDCPARESGRVLHGAGRADAHTTGPRAVYQLHGPPWQGPDEEVRPVPVEAARSSAEPTSAPQTADASAPQ